MPRARAKRTESWIQSPRAGRACHWLSQGALPPELRVVEADLQAHRGFATLLAAADAGAGARVVQRYADQCSALVNLPYMCWMEHQPFCLPFILEMMKYHSSFSNHLRDTTCAKKRSPGWTWQMTDPPLEGSSLWLSAASAHRPPPPCSRAPSP